jgi:xylose isomerase
MFLAHISGMDTLARGLRNVAKLIEVTEDTLRPTELSHVEVFKLEFLFCDVRMVP